MDNLEEVLTRFNNGKLRGAKKKLAGKIKVGSSALSDWLGRRTRPGEDKIKKLATVLNISMSEAKELFIGAGYPTISQNAKHINNHNGSGDQIVHHGDIEMFYEKFKTIEAKIDALKIVEMKIDLLLERISGKES
jgi:transcriptional regulator with XRE-family HTH domain